LHIKAVTRTSIALLIAWPISITLTYLIARNNIAPRSISVIHLMLSVISVLGLRAGIRLFDEWQHDNRLEEEAQTAVPGFDKPPISLNDILGRDPISIDTVDIRNYLSSRTVLVTGAGGSIGSELCKLLVTLNPFRLVLVDVSEYNLFQLENTVRQEPFAGEIVFRIADVRDEEIMRTVFSSYRPDVIFHAAAYKHVPLMERHPIEAFRNNTLSTVSLIRLCEVYDAEQFIFVSTDKAITPTSVLGATKRLAEWYVRAANSPMQRKIVRFGNVFGSQGSVVEIFQNQIESGDPVTITHPDMTRYFMSADEACMLILETLVLDTDTPVYMLQMGEPVAISWLAERMIQLLNPTGSVSIEYTGIRPGERLEEHLRSTVETPVPTKHPAVIGLKSYAPYSRAELDSYLNELQRLCKQNKVEELRKALFLTQFQNITNINVENTPGTGVL
jgi:FlaA1/EpsC-like NDP-sugar epimerase